MKTPVIILAGATIIALLISGALLINGYFERLQRQCLAYLEQYSLGTKPAEGTDLYVNRGQAYRIGNKHMLYCHHIDMFDEQHQTRDNWLF